MRKMFLVLIGILFLISCGKNQQELKTELTNKGYKWNIDGFLERISENDKKGVKLYLEAGWRTSTKYDRVIREYSSIDNPDPEIFKILVNDLQNKYFFLENAMMLCVQSQNHYVFFKIVLESVKDNLPEEGKLKLISEAWARAKTVNRWMPDSYEQFIIKPLRAEW